jgi:hypothetical protein
MLQTVEIQSPSLVEEYDHMQPGGNVNIGQPTLP